MRSLSSELTLCRGIIERYKLTEIDRSHKKIAEGATVEKVGSRGVIR